MTLEILQNYPNKNWDWELISCNQSITIDIINCYMNKPLNWKFISYNTSITMKLINQNLDKPWDWNHVSYNPNFNLDMFIQHQNKITILEFISGNLFKYNHRLINLHLHKLKKIRKRVTSFKIKNWYKLYLLTKTEKFMKWYCAPGNIGNKVDKSRITNFLYATQNK